MSGELIDQIGALKNAILRGVDVFTTLKETQRTNCQAIADENQEYSELMNWLYSLYTSYNAMYSRNQTNSNDEFARKKEEYKLQIIKYEQDIAQKEKSIAKKWSGMLNEDKTLKNLIYEVSKDLHKLKIKYKQGGQNGQYDYQNWVLKERPLVAKFLSNKYNFVCPDPEIDQYIHSAQTRTREAEAAANAAEVTLSDIKAQLGTAKQMKKDILRELAQIENDFEQRIQELQNKYEHAQYTQLKERYPPGTSAV